MCEEVDVDEEAEQGRGGGIREWSSETPSPSLKERHFIRWLGR